MLVRAAKSLARQWVLEEAASLPGFYGAYLAGSVTGWTDDDPLPSASDVDVMVVLDRATAPPKPGKFVYAGVLLEATYLALDEVRTPEIVLGHYHLAPAFRQPIILADPTGHLTTLASVVARDFAKRTWVLRRCEQAQQRVEERVHSIHTQPTLHNRVMAWLFAAGGMPHVLLTAALHNPTVRRRYVAVREVLAAAGRLDVYALLLAHLGSAHMTPEQVAAHVTALAPVFDAATSVAKTPLPYSSDLTHLARPIAIDGSREMIAQGDHREAVFWIAVTYSRCRHVLAVDGSEEMLEGFDPGYWRLLADLGIHTEADLEQRGAAILAALPKLWAVTEEIVDANPEIEAG